MTSLRQPGSERLEGAPEPPKPGRVPIVIEADSSDEDAMIMEADYQDVQSEYFTIYSSLYQDYRDAHAGQNPHQEKREEFDETANQAMILKYTSIWGRFQEEWMRKMDSEEH